MTNADTESAPLAETINNVILHSPFHICWVLYTFNKSKNIEEKTSIFLVFIRTVGDELHIFLDLWTGTRFTNLILFNNSGEVFDKAEHRYFWMDCGGGYVTMLLIFDILLYVAFEANENKDVWCIHQLLYMIFTLMITLMIDYVICNCFGRKKDKVLGLCNWIKTLLRLL